MSNSSLLRKTILNARDALHFPERQSMSCEIIQKVLLLEEIATSKTLFIYVDFRSEVETHFLIAELLKQGKRVVVPVTLVKEKRLLPVSITDLEKDLVPGYCSIPEPRPAIREHHMVASSEIDTIILPGSVFDERGGRLGYGGGYYDRFMACEAPKALRIGLTFDFQVIDRLDLQAHDKLLDLIITEKRIIHGKR